MVTREQIEKYFGEDADVESSFGTNQFDDKLKALNVLRDRIPYDKADRIIVGAEHDIIYLVEVEEAMPYLNEEDLQALIDCNVCVNEDTDSFTMYT